jgi:hypothetical protein
VATETEGTNDRENDHGKGKKEGWTEDQARCCGPQGRGEQAESRGEEGRTQNGGQEKNGGTRQDRKEVGGAAQDGGGEARHPGGSVTSSDIDGRHAAKTIAVLVPGVTADERLASLWFDRDRRKQIARKAA